MLSKQDQYQGKADFLRLSFQNSISRNIRKGELSRILLRQSYIDCGMKVLLLLILNDTVNDDTLDVKKLYSQEKLQCN